MQTWESVLGWVIKHFDIVPLDVWLRQCNVATFVAEVSVVVVVAAAAAASVVALAMESAFAVVAAAVGCGCDGGVDDGDAVKYWVANPIDLESQTHSTRSVTGFRPCIFRFFHLGITNWFFFNTKIVAKN